MKKFFINVVTFIVMACTALNMHAQNITAKYQIHETADTKTIVLDGGIKSWCQFSEGKALIKWKNGWFVINNKGEKVFDLPKGYAPMNTASFNEGGIYDHNRLMAYSESEKIAVIYDERGNIVKAYKDIKMASGFADGVAALCKSEKRNGSWSYVNVWYHIDINGNVLSNTMPVTSSTMVSYRLYFAGDGLSRVYYENEKKWGYRNLQCQWVITPRFKDARGFSCGLAAVKNDEGKWGYIDKTGNWVIQPIYSNEPGQFKKGLALVTDKNGYHYFINTKGEYVWKETSRNFNVYPFSESGYNIFVENRNCYLINTSFQKVFQSNALNSRYGWNTHIVASNDKWFQWRDGDTDTNRLIDYRGNVLLEFTSYDFFEDGLCTASNYYFNDKGEIIVKFVDTQF